MGVTTGKSCRIKPIAILNIWLRSVLQRKCFVLPSRLTVPVIMLDIVTGWTLKRIAEIKRLERIFAEPDTRPLSASDLSAANRKHDEMLAHSPWFRLWQRYGVCSRVGVSVRPLAATSKRLVSLLISRTCCASSPTAGAEMGTDCSQFPTAAHLASWAGVCPGNNESAGKRISSKRQSLVASNGLSIRMGCGSYEEHLSFSSV